MGNILFLGFTNILTFTHCNSRSFSIPRTQILEYCGGEEEADDAASKNAAGLNKNQPDFGYRPAGGAV